MSVRIFITGGTFDKEYDEITGSCTSRTLIWERYWSLADLG